MKLRRRSSPLRRALRKAKESIMLLEWRLRSESQRLAEARLQLAQERGWRYDAPAGMAAARMEALRESGAMEPEPLTEKPIRYVKRRSQTIR